MIKTIKRLKRRLCHKDDLVENINLDLLRDQKRCLISYITTSLKVDIEAEAIASTNVLEANQIIKAFIDLGYSIDIIDCLDASAFETIKHKRYDVIFGFGVVFDDIAVTHPDARKVLYMTEHHPEFSKVKETERVEYFYERHNKKVELTRSGQYYKNSDFDNIDDAIVLGELFPYEAYDFDVHSLSPTGFYNDDYHYVNRDLGRSRNNFLWFGSGGAIHKGLDLLIDIFSQRDDIHLHICGLNKIDRKDLGSFEKENIHDYGRIDVKGDLFLELVDRCSFVILPSCSEGMSTSVLTCMRHSMIPIVMRDTGFNALEEMAFLLDDHRLTYLEKELDRIRQSDDDTLSEMHKKIYAFANEEFTLERFSSRFVEIMKGLLKDD